MCKFGQISDGKIKFCSISDSELAADKIRYFSNITTDKRYQDNPIAIK